MLKTRRVRVEKLQPSKTIPESELKSGELRILKSIQDIKKEKLTFKDIQNKSGYRSRSRLYEYLRNLHAARKICIDRITGYGMGKGRCRYNYYLLSEEASA